MVETGKPRILFVDDEQLVLDALRRQHGRRFAITSALGASAALEIVRNELSFAVVVSDHNMPETDGVSLLAKMREIAPHTIRILLTGQADAKVKALATTVGAVFRFVAKPCESATLEAILNAAVIEHYMLLSQASTKIVPAPSGSGAR